MENKRRFRLLCLIGMAMFIIFSSSCLNNNIQKGKEVKTGVAYTNLDVYNFILTVDNPFMTEQIPYKPTSYSPKLKPYNIKGNLSNVVNKAQFGSFTKAQRALISKNGFCTVSTSDEQLFYTYENNEYLKIPNFITADSVLQLYNVFFDYSLRNLESHSLVGKITLLTDSLLNKQIMLYNMLKNPAVKKAALKNIAYFEVGDKLLGKAPSTSIPKEAEVMASAELKAINGEKPGFFKSVIFDTKLDYSQYLPRGHYSREEDLKKYFKAMMWYGQAPFKLFVDKNEKTLQLDTTLQALLITYSLYYNNGRQSDIKLWEDIYNPTVFYVGKTDDLNIYNYKEMLIKAFGNNINLDKLTNKTIVNSLITEGQKLPEPQIVNEYGDKAIEVSKQFRFMGQRYIPDSEILQKLSNPKLRPIPKGLDVMGVLGSDRAKDILINNFKENENWNKYTDKFNELRNKFTNLGDNVWKSNMYYGWLWSLNPIIDSFGNGYPQFMRNSAWQDKSLNTALGSWSELRHDTILYAKQSGAECGGDELPPGIKSYVEPNVKFYDRLLWLTKYSEKNLSDRNLIDMAMVDKLKSLEDLFTFLINCSVKELNNQELTSDEYDQLLIYGGTLEYLSSSFANGDGRWSDITSEADRNMAGIADVHTSGTTYLEEGVGNAAQIYVVVPIGSKLYLTRGAVFQYYEFISGQRLRDEDWQKTIKQNKVPEQPSWTKSYRGGGSKKVPQPKVTFSSGC